MSNRTMVRTAVALGLALMPLAATAAPSAQATTGSCVKSGTVGGPGSGGSIVWDKYWCHNRYHAPVYNYYNQIVYMDSTYSWFICQEQRGANPVTYNSSGTANYNNWWVFTMADTGYGGGRWGYMPATYINEGSNWSPVPGVPTCDQVAH